MKLQIIEIPDYILAVSHEEIVPKDKFLADNLYMVTCNNLVSDTFINGNFYRSKCKKIAAYQPKNNTPELLSIIKYGNMTFKELNGDGSYYECIDCEVQTIRSGEFLKSQGVELYKNKHELDLPLLPEISVEDDVEKLAKNAYVKHGVKDDKLTLDEQIQRTGGFLVGFKEGYKAATKVYSEEDLRRAIIMSANSNTDFLPDRCDEIIQSIKQTKTSCFPSHCLRECSNICLYPNKTPKWFVAETEDLFHSPSPIGMSVDTVLKTTTINSKTYLVGTYLYE
jgi:hypothetical protein